MKEALFYEKLGDKKLRCKLCARDCQISEGKSGFCRVRKNIDGKLYSFVYGKPCTIAIDPIEKKPLYHFLPGTNALSIATVGCNFRCSFCQNFDISQPEKIIGNEISPEKIVESAINSKVRSIAYTYTEPTIFYEYALEIMKIANKKGLKNIWVSNGYTTKEPIKKIAPFLDAVNIDIKGDDKAYNEICMASLKPVLESLKEYKKQKIWIELTCLIIPGKNDSKKWMDKITLWINENLGEETPIHLSRFFPNYRMRGVGATPFSTLKALYRVANKNLKNVYIGNVPPGKEHNTFCYGCGEECINRSGSCIETKLKGSRCESCGREIACIFEKSSKKTKSR
jgi:pyruvate formate lyase activating enzyme